MWKNQIPFFEWVQNKQIWIEIQENILHTGYNSWCDLTLSCRINDFSIDESAVYKNTLAFLDIQRNRVAQMRFENRDAMPFSLLLNIPVLKSLIENNNRKRWNVNSNTSKCNSIHFRIVSSDEARNYVSWKTNICFKMVIGITVH